MGKTGLVVEGGGMKCAYNAGILDRFLDENIHFDYCIGVSAGSANVASYLAGQRDRNLRFYTQHTTLPEYMGVRNFLRTGQFFGLQFIYGTLTNTGGADPIDYPAIMANPSEYELVATDAGTGEATYFNKYDLKQDDYTAIMASCALPALCRPVSYNGHLYYDGGVADSIPVERAFAQGCDRVVVILSNPRSYVKQKEGLRFASAQIPKASCRSRQPSPDVPQKHRGCQFAREGRQCLRLCTDDRPRSLRILQRRQNRTGTVRSWRPKF